jgi:hypothetical protein
MHPVEKDILQALDELDAAVQGMGKTEPKPNLISLFERIDALSRQLPKQTNPELAHFLARKSYEKARLLLRGEGARNARGACA